MSALKLAALRNIASMFVTDDTSHAPIAPVNTLDANICVISVTNDTSHAPMF